MGYDLMCKAFYMRDILDRQAEDILSLLAYQECRVRAFLGEYKLGGVVGLYAMAFQRFGKLFVSFGFREGGCAADKHQCGEQQGEESCYGAYLLIV